ncbi:unnamed protein product [Somion occarium]|uniref:Guanine nucleotide-binding protein-like 1 n=1 Tax=Somion occarium TaxID=3059160 RepID=A0ABP1CKB7_9APHY
MPRKVAFSAKQKKAQLRLKRAVKRGDISPPPKQDRRRKTRKGPSNSAHDVDAVESVRRLQSAFVKLPREFLERTKVLAATLPLERPISSEVALLHDPAIAAAHPSIASGLEPDQLLTCPVRPKWRYDMTKAMVEKNEEVIFTKWLDRTDEAVNKWCNAQEDQATPSTDEQLENKQPVMPHAPTSFERNIEVWRQLWRVTEISQILLILLDARCPLLHYPPSLSAYLSNPYLARRTRTILVLTKVDIVGPVRAEAWTRFLKQKYPNLRIVQVESYIEKSAGEGSGQRKHYEPHLPSTFRQTLVEALKETHAEFLEPPVRLKDFPEKLAKWKPSVKRNIDWDAVLHARGGQVGTVVGGATAPRPTDLPPQGIPENSDEEDEQREAEPEPEVFTIGLIGQPNVGKSSLLNALFGITKVKASRTPGKTKHFQTLFWTPEVRLVDCPGLVMPNLVPMESQVFSGIFPISRVSAVPLCIYHAAQLLPLERIYGLQHPSLLPKPEEDKRTWREPRAGAMKEQKELKWTAMDILTAYALKKGWMTARTGWPDVHRAGNAMLRAVAEGKIHWGFWPLDTELSTVEEHHGVGNGIWIPTSEHHDFDWDFDSDAGHDDRDVDDVSDEEEEGSTDVSADETSEDESPTATVSATAGRFKALLLDDRDEEVDDDET